MTSAKAICEALSCGASGCPCGRAAQRGGGLVHCSAHSDRTPSLSVTEKNGVVLVHCHASCSQEAVVDSLKERGLWASTNGNAPVRRASPAAGPARTYRWELRDAAGELIAIHHRRDPEKRYWWELPTGETSLGGQHPSELPLYFADTLADVPAGERIFLCEGERATEALVEAGLYAVGTVCGAGVTPCDDALRPLLGRMVYLWPDADPVNNQGVRPGQEHMQRIRERLRLLGHDAVLTISWPEAPEKGDAADYMQAGPDAVHHGLGGLDALCELAFCEHREAGSAEAAWEMFKTEPAAAACCCCAGPMDRARAGDGLCPRCRPQPAAPAELPVPGKWSS